MKYQICLPTHREKDRAFLSRERVCFTIYIDQRRQGPIPPDDPEAHLNALANIAQLAQSLSDLTPLHQELNDIAQKALQSAVDGLGEGAELVVLDA